MIVWSLGIETLGQLKYSIKYAQTTSVLPPRKW